jgi:Ca-activated chloride channel family protein
MAIGCAQESALEQTISEVDGKARLATIVGATQPAPAEPPIESKEFDAGHDRPRAQIELRDDGARRDALVEPEVAASPPMAIKKEKRIEESTARQFAATSDQLEHRRPAMNKLVVSPTIRHAVEPLDRENYSDIVDNGVKLVREEPVSTFSVDVDTAAYANVRRYLTSGRLPPADAVRIEEMINYFDYAYSAPDSREQPFSVATEIAPSPWAEDRHLLQVGIKGYEMSAAQLPPANLVFLIDVSGSMQAANKLPLLKQALSLLVSQMRAQDRVSMVVYAGASGVVLEPTSGAHKWRINRALGALHAGGSTNGASGIRLAYQVAEQAKIAGGINRVILATDGDFDVGTVNVEALKDLIERKRDSGVTLSVLGFGNGNYNDHLMEELSNRGNGNAAYIDSLQEAQKVLVSEMSGTLATIAKDVKIQVEFNPQAVREYRLIGYVNRKLRREDFNNDKIDAGDIGAGHTVTALYEVQLVGSGKGRIDSLRYSPTPGYQTDRQVPELAYLRLRYKLPESKISQLIEQPILREQVLTHLATATPRLRFAAAVAGFGQLLRGGNHTGAFGYDQVLEVARSARAEDIHGYRSEFLRLVQLAKQIDAAS